MTDGRQCGQCAELLPDAPGDAALPWEHTGPAGASGRIERLTSESQKLWRDLVPVLCLGVEDIFWCSAAAVTKMYRCTVM